MPRVLQKSSYKIFHESQARRIFLAYNLPFFLWLAAAALLNVGCLPKLPCLVHEFFSFCLACGLTRELGSALRLDFIGAGAFLWLVVFGFLVNFVCSLLTCRNHYINKNRSDSERIML